MRYFYATLISFFIFAHAAVAEDAKPTAEAKKAAASKPLTRPVVVELFTSQGCSSCTVSDGIMLKLSRDATVLPLSFHVDYMDGGGWKDPFSKEAFGKRQMMYIKKHNGGSLFTPHMVVDGRRSVTGTNAGMISIDIMTAKSKGIEVPITVKLDNAGKNLVIKLAGEQDGLDIKSLPVGAELYKITYGKQKKTEVTIGANAGKTLTNTNVVSSIEFMGEWLGKTVFLKVPTHTVKDEAVAFILQESDMGPIIGAASYTMVK